MSRDISNRFDVTSANVYDKTLCLRRFIPQIKLQLFENLVEIAAFLYLPTEIPSTVEQNLSINKLFQYKN